MSTKVRRHPRVDKTRVTIFGDLGIEDFFASRKSVDGCCTVRNLFAYVLVEAFLDYRPSSPTFRDFRKRNQRTAETSMQQRSRDCQ
mmetsp:Transcript_22305/g.89883  ORF Transcript_22305/g.89883 Transcript_22305/m.89883 type:complete len:86 (+) Transcript_22305:195-452(+)